MTEEEYNLYTNTSGAKYTRWFIPVSWAVNLMNQLVGFGIVETSVPLLNRRIAAFATRRHFDSYFYI